MWKILGGILGSLNQKPDYKTEQPHYFPQQQNNNTQKMFLTIGLGIAAGYIINKLSKNS